MYRLIQLGNPFDRKDILMNLIYYVEKGWGSYNELIELSVKDLYEIKVAIDSKQQEEELSKAMHG